MWAFRRGDRTQCALRRRSNGLRIDEDLEVGGSRPVLAHPPHGLHGLLDRQAYESLDKGTFLGIRASLSEVDEPLLRASKAEERATRKVDGVMKHRSSSAPDCLEGGIL